MSELFPPKVKTLADRVSEFIAKVSTGDERLDQLIKIQKTLEFIAAQEPLTKQNADEIIETGTILTAGAHQTIISADAAKIVYLDKIYLHGSIPMRLELFTTDSSNAFLISDFGDLEQNEFTVKREFKIGTGIRIRINTYFSISVFDSTYCALGEYRW